MVIDDGTVTRLDSNRFRITAADPSYRWFEDCGYGLNFNIDDVTEDLAALALQGPKSLEILLSSGITKEINKLKYYRYLETKLDNIPISITRTGFAGDLGYELWINPKHAIKLWDILMEVGNNYRLTPIGLIALDMLRIEAGLLLIDVDYNSSFKAILDSQKSSPYELGLGWTVKINKNDFIGKKALTRGAERGSDWSFIGLDIDWVSMEKEYGKVDLPPQISPQSSRIPAPIYRNNQFIGQATSLTFSPMLKKYIALGSIKSKYAKIGSIVDVEITVEYQRRKARAQITSSQFFNPQRKRAVFHDQ